MDNIFAYKIGNSLYINLTNRCSNDCAFCERNNYQGIGDYDLWLEHEPTSKEVIEQIKGFIVSQLHVQPLFRV